MNVLETEALTRRFGELAAVDCVSLSVQKGEVFGLVGPNGAGKSTLIKMLTTLLPPSEGRALVCGFDVVKCPARVRHSIGYVPQLVSADGELTGYENLMLFANLYDVPRKERRSRVEQALAFMNLLDVADRQVKTYSGGMVRRLEIAESMLHRPKLMLLDEPTVGLDPVARANVWKHILELRDEFGATILLTTHLMDEIEGTCDRMAIMSLGKMVAVGTPSDLKASINGGEGATLDDVFIHFAGMQFETCGGFREASRMRRNAKRLG